MIPADAPQRSLALRLRRIVRRRVRIEVAALAANAATASDEDRVIRIETVSPRDPHLLAWTADGPLALVVLHDGCGARVVGGGGLAGRVELPSGLCQRASLTFCYDAEAASGA